MSPAVVVVPTLPAPATQAKKWTVRESMPGSERQPLQIATNLPDRRVVSETINQRNSAPMHALPVVEVRKGRVGVMQGQSPQLRSVSTAVSSARPSPQFGQALPNRSQVPRQHSAQYPQPFPLPLSQYPPPPNVPQPGPHNELYAPTVHGEMLRHQQAQQIAMRQGVSMTPGPFPDQREFVSRMTQVNQQTQQVALVNQYPSYFAPGTIAQVLPTAPVFAQSGHGISAPAQFPHIHQPINLPPGVAPIPFHAQPFPVDAVQGGQYVSGGQIQNQRERRGSNNRGRGRGRGNNYNSGGGRRFSQVSQENTNTYQQHGAPPEYPVNVRRNSNRFQENRPPWQVQQWNPHVPKGRRLSAAEPFPTYTDDGFQPLSEDPGLVITRTSIGPDVEGVLQLWVGNLDETTTAQELQNFFGEVVPVHFVIGPKQRQHDEGYFASIE